MHIVPRVDPEDRGSAVAGADCCRDEALAQLVPETFVFTQVLVTLPWDQPVVRPTLFTTFPTSAVASAVILKSPTIVSKRPG